MTPTWYTAPLDFENLQIPNAFILPFSRTVPGMFTVNNKKYAGLQFYFIVFPYHEGSFTVPSINITAQTPPEGSSQSQKVLLHTTSIPFVVKPIPKNMEGNNWFVAKNVFISEKWNKPLQNLKVGDIIERTVTIDAKGTLPQFIPQLSADSLDFASAYLQDASLRDERNDYDANGSITQSILYLLEKEGKFTIPSIQVSWWNPNSSKLYSRSAFAQKIHVNPNPNLGIVATLKDSLQSKQVSVVTTVVQKKKMIFGIAWYWFLSIALVGLMVLYQFTRLLIRLIRNYRERHARYLLSEEYAFKKFMHSSLQSDSFINNLYAWWDRLKIPGKSSSISWQMRREHFENIHKDLNDFFINSYNPAMSAFDANVAIKNDLSAYRKSIGNKDTIEDKIKISIFQSIWLTRNKNDIKTS